MSGAREGKYFVVEDGNRVLKELCKQSGFMCKVTNLEDKTKLCEFYTKTKNVAQDKFSVALSLHVSEADRTNLKSPGWTRFLKMVFRERQDGILFPKGVVATTEHVLTDLCTALSTAGYKPSDTENGKEFDFPLFDLGDLQTTTNGFRKIEVMVDFNHSNVMAHHHRVGTDLINETLTVIFKTILPIKPDAKYSFAREDADGSPAADKAGAGGYPADDGASGGLPAAGGVVVVQAIPFDGEPPAVKTTRNRKIQVNLLEDVPPLELLPGGERIKPTYKTNKRKRASSVAQAAEQDAQETEDDEPVAPPVAPPVAQSSGDIVIVIDDD